MEALQTQRDTPSRGLVKAEFQQFFKYLAVPSIMTDVRKRVRQNGETISGLDMGEVVARMDEELEGASELMLEGLWTSPVTKQLKRAQQDAAKKAKKAEAAAEFYAAAKQQAVACADSHAVKPEELITVLGACRQAEMNATATLEVAAQAHRRAEEIKAICEPSQVPFVVTADNCPSYSLLEGSSQTDVVPGIAPINQVSQMLV